MRKPRTNLKKRFRDNNLKYDEEEIIILTYDIALDYFCKVAPNLWHIHKINKVHYDFLIDVAYSVFEAHEKTIKSNSTKS